jgi:hypothetical protein
LGERKFSSPFSSSFEELLKYDAKHSDFRAADYLLREYLAGVGGEVTSRELGEVN